MATCGTCHSKKKKIGLRIQNVDLLQLRLTQQEKFYYTNLFYDYSNNDLVSRQTFPQLLGMLGTDIAENFADRIFEVFSTDKESISLCNYLKYLDVYHYGNEEERCLVTCKLMDYNTDGKIRLIDFQKYIKLILMAVRKVNPGISLEILNDKDIKMLFDKIAENKDSFTYQDFDKVYKEKPELVSWIDYFKNNNTDILIVIDQNIKKFLKIIKGFFAEFSTNIKQLLKDESKTQIDLSVLHMQIKTFCETIESNQKSFLKSIDPFNVRSVFDKLLNNQTDTIGTKYINHIRSSQQGFSAGNDIEIIKDIPIINNQLANISPHTAGHFSKGINKFFNKFKNDLVEENIHDANIKNAENVTDEEDNKLNEGHDYQCQAGNISYENGKITTPRSKPIDIKSIELIPTEPNQSNKRRVSFNEPVNKTKKVIGPNICNLNINKVLYQQQGKDNLLLNELLHILEQFSISSQKVTNNIDESYRWIKKTYLAEHIKKAKQPKKAKTIKRNDNFDVKNIPKKALKSKKQYLIKAPDQSFKLLLNMIMGIQIAVQSTPNYDINPDKDDLNNYLNNLSYSIQTTNFGQKKQESFYIKEYAGMIFNNIRKIIGFNKDSFIASISPQDFITEIMVSSQTIFEELCSTGKSGSLFYYTRDGKFILKTIGKTEYYFLKKILPNYFKHLKANPFSLLPKFLGCYQLVKKVKKERSKYYFLIMLNIFATSNEIHVRYDLKGSTIGRKVLNQTIKDNDILSKGNFALKDLDFDFSKRFIQVGERRDLIFNQLKADSEFLSKNNINDYSLLLGFHIFSKLEQTQSMRAKTQKPFFLGKSLGPKRNKTMLDKIPGVNNLDRSVNGKEVHELGISHMISEQNNNYNSEESLSAYNHSIESENANNQMRHPFIDHEDGGIESTDKSEIYYIGIIDILTEYNCLKHTEHFFKMMYYCSQKMSCVDPLTYKNRFLRYLKTKIVNNEEEYPKSKLPS